MGERERGRARRTADAAGSAHLGPCRAAGVLCAMRTGGAFHDGTVVAGGHELRVHRAVVCELSPFFAAAFRGGFAEAGSGRLELRDASAAGAAALVRFAYGEDAFGGRAPDVWLALEVLELAHRFQVPRLPEKAARRAAAAAGVDEYVPAFRALRRFGMTAAVGALFHKMAAGYEPMLRSNAIRLLTSEELGALVRSRDLVAQESALLQGIAQWTLHDAAARAPLLGAILLNARLQKPSRARADPAEVLRDVPLDDPLEPLEVPLG